MKNFTRTTNKLNGFALVFCFSFLVTGLAMGAGTQVLSGNLDIQRLVQAELEFVRVTAQALREHNGQIPDARVREFESKLRKNEAGILGVRSNLERLNTDDTLTLGEHNAVLSWHKHIAAKLRESHFFSSAGLKEEEVRRLILELETIDRQISSNSNFNINNKKIVVATIPRRQFLTSPELANLEKPTRVEVHINAPEKPGADQKSELAAAKAALGDQPSVAAKQIGVLSKIADQNLARAVVDGDDAQIAQLAVRDQRLAELRKAIPEHFKWDPTLPNAIEALDERALLEASEDIFNDPSIKRQLKSELGIDLDSIYGSKKSKADQLLKRLKGQSPQRVAAFFDSVLFELDADLDATLRIIRNPEHSEAARANLNPVALRRIQKAYGIAALMQKVSLEPKFQSVVSEALKHFQEQSGEKSALHRIGFWRRAGGGFGLAVVAGVGVSLLTQLSGEAQAASLTVARPKGKK